MEEIFGDIYPMLLMAVIGGLSLLAVIVAVVYKVKKARARAAEDAEAPGPRSPGSPAMRAASPEVPLVRPPNGIRTPGVAQGRNTFSPPAAGMMSTPPSAGSPAPARGPNDVQGESHLAAPRVSPAHHLPGAPVPHAPATAAVTVLPLASAHDATPHQPAVNPMTINTMPKAEHTAASPIAQTVVPPRPQGLPPAPPAQTPPPVAQQHPERPAAPPAVPSQDGPIPTGSAQDGHAGITGAPVREMFSQIQRPVSAAAPVANAAEAKPGEFSQIQRPVSAAVPVANAAAANPGEFTQIKRPGSAAVPVANAAASRPGEFSQINHVPAAAQFAQAASQPASAQSAAGTTAQANAQQGGSTDLEME